MRLQRPGRDVPQHAPGQPRPAKECGWKGSGGGLGKERATTLALTGIGLLMEAHGACCEPLRHTDLLFPFLGLSNPKRSGLAFRRIRGPSPSRPPVRFSCEVRYWPCIIPMASTPHLNLAKGADFMAIDKARWSLAILLASGLVLTNAAAASAQTPT